MKLFLKTLAVIVVNLAGYFTLPFLYVLATKANLLGFLNNATLRAEFLFWYFQLGPWVWVVAAAISLAAFFSRRAQGFLIAAPVALPVIYSCLTLLYFNAVPAG